MVSATKLILIVGLAIAAGVVSYTLFARSRDASERQKQFRVWATKYGKNYGGEQGTRFNVWNDNVEVIEKHNAKKLTWTLEANEFADLTDDEFVALHTGLDPETSKKQRTVALSTENLPRSVNWLNSIPLKYTDQGHCGSCWAFSTIGAMEALHNITTGKYVAFSEQQLVDCNRNVNNNGCGGGEMYDAFAYIAENGILTGEDYPYLAVDGKCRYNASKVAFRNTNYNHVPANDSKQLKAATARNVVSIAIHSRQATFKFYKSGVITNDCIAEELTHAIVLVAYEVSDDGEYWIVKNSWKNWGDNGTAKIAVGQHNDGKGLCGVNMDASYPIIEKN